MKKIVIGVFVLAVCIAGGAYGYVQYRDQQFTEKLVPIVKASTVRVNAMLELQGAAKVTWKEVFERADGHVADMEKLALPLKELTPVSDSQTIAVAKADAYVKSAQAFVRAQNGLTRAIFQHNALGSRLVFCAK